MGAVHSRRSYNGVHTVNSNNHIERSDSITSSPSTYFLLVIHEDRLKMINAEVGERKCLRRILRKYCNPIEEGWDRHMGYFFKLKTDHKNDMVHIICDALVDLRESGWKIEASVNTNTKEKPSGQTTLCFKRFIEEKSPSVSCVCLEGFSTSSIALYRFPNPLTLDLVVSLQAEGVKGVSMAVNSIIKDYIPTVPPIISSNREFKSDKIISLEGDPWTEPSFSDQLLSSITSCLDSGGFKHTMEINLSFQNRLFFFMKETEISELDLKEENTYQKNRSRQVLVKSSSWWNQTSTDVEVDEEYEDESSFLT